MPTKLRAKMMETFIKYSIDDICEDYKLTDEQIEKEWKKVIKYDCSNNKNSFVGNKLLYHYQFANLTKTTRKNKQSFADRIQDDDAYKTLWEQTKQRSRAGTVKKRLFEAHQINTGSIVFFKTCNAMYLYKKYNASKILDPCAGWGGRGIGAVALGLHYTGMDTNISLRPSYEKMFAGKDNINMIWQSCLDVDFSDINFDFVLTSPPYIDLEIYEHMEAFQTKDNFYNSFLIPLINKCRKYCKGVVAFNIAPDMYKDLTKKYGYELCCESEDLKEQKQGKTPDCIYIWGKSQTSPKSRERSTSSKP